jgi:hypothetical protein
MNWLLLDQGGTCLGEADEEKDQAWEWEMRMTTKTEAKARFLKRLLRVNVKFLLEQVVFSNSTVQPPISFVRSSLDVVSRLKPTVGI